MPKISVQAYFQGKPVRWNFSGEPTKDTIEILFSVFGDRYIFTAKDEVDCYKGEETVAVFKIKLKPNGKR